MAIRGVFHTFATAASSGSTPTDMEIYRDDDTTFALADTQRELDDTRAALAQRERQLAETEAQLAEREAALAAMQTGARPPPPEPSPTPRSALVLRSLESKFARDAEEAPLPSGSSSAAVPLDARGLWVALYVIAFWVAVYIVVARLTL